MPGREITTKSAFISRGNIHDCPAPAIAPVPEGEVEPFSPRKQFLGAAARVKRTFEQAAKQGRFMYLGARFKISSQVHAYTKKRSKRVNVDNAEIIADEEADDVRDDVSDADVDGDAYQESGLGPKVSLHIVAAQSVNTPSPGFVSEDMSLYDTLLPPRLPWSGYFGNSSYSVNASQSSIGILTPSASGYLSPTDSTSTDQSRSQSFLKLRPKKFLSNVFTSIDATGSIGINSSGSSSGWGTLFPLRFTSSKSTMDHSDSDLLGTEAARAARRLEKEEDEAAAREMKAKREARDKEMKRIEDEMRMKRKDKAREGRLKRERKNEARVKSTGHFPLH